MVHLLHGLMKSSLVDELEMLAHIQQQSGLPPREQNLLIQLLQIALLGLGILGILIQLMIMFGIGIWIVAALFIDARSYIFDMGGVGNVVIIILSLFCVQSSLEFVNSGVLRSLYLSFRYPCMIIDLLENVLNNGHPTIGKIESIESDKKVYRIVYGFHLPEAGYTVSSFRTRNVSQFEINDDITILYMDSQIHLPVRG